MDADVIGRFRPADLDLVARDRGCGDVLGNGGGRGVGRGRRGLRALDHQLRRVIALPARQGERRRVGPLDPEARRPVARDQRGDVDLAPAVGGDRPRGTDVGPDRRRVVEPDRRLPPAVVCDVTDEVAVGVGRGRPDPQLRRLDRARDPARVEAQVAVDLGRGVDPQVGLGAVVLGRVRGVDLGVGDRVEGCLGDRERRRRGRRGGLRRGVAGVVDRLERVGVGGARGEAGVGVAALIGVERDQRPPVAADRVVIDADVVGRGRPAQVDLAGGDRGRCDARGGGRSGDVAAAAERDLGRDARRRLGQLDPDPVGGRVVPPDLVGGVELRLRVRLSGSGSLGPRRRWGRRSPGRPRARRSSRPGWRGSARSSSRSSSSSAR